MFKGSQNLKNRNFSDPLPAPELNEASAEFCIRLRIMLRRHAPALTGLPHPRYVFPPSDVLGTAE
jgi:hypothetical protein